MSKKALVWNEGQPGTSTAPGVIFMISSLDRINSWTNFHKKRMVIVDVPVELEDKELYELEAVQIDGEWVIQEKPTE